MTAAPPPGRTCTIIGAGLAGSLLACYLARRGWSVSIYERRPDPRIAGYSGGRSINLALSVRGIRGLEGVDLASEVLADAIPMRGRALHSRTGSHAFQAYSKNKSDAINSVSRGLLNITLLNAAEKQGEGRVRFFFNHRCLDIDPDECSAVFEEDRGPAEKPRLVPVKAELIVGADGAFSAVRTRLIKIDRFDYSQSYLTHGYKELHIPSAATLGRDELRPDGFALDPHALHIWPGRGGGTAMMIALPNKDKTFTCTLFWPFDGPHGFSNLKTPEQVLRHFETHYPDFPALSPTLAEDFLRNPTSSLVTVRCWPWVYTSPRGTGSTVIMGDAAHAIVPFYGQGMNAAFEDVRTFAECLDTHGQDPIKALPEFQSLRKEHADAIADMALANFIEMRDKVASPLFRMKKKFEHALHALIPQWYEPLYHMISFTTIPYADARRRAERQDRAILWTIVILAALLLGIIVGIVRR